MVATATVARATSATPPPPWFVLFDAYAEEQGADDRYKKAALLGVHYTTYWRYGRGLARPSAPVERRIAKRLGASVEVLFPVSVS